MINVVVLGGHGDGLVAAGVIHDMAQTGIAIRLAGYLNDALSVGELIHGAPVLGGTRDWRSLDDSHVFHVCLHKVGQMRQRSELIESFAIPDERLVSLIHPTATIASDVIIQPGALIASHVTCQPGTKIGRYATVRAGANLGHDTVMEDFAYLGPNATLCGCARLLRGAHAGPNSVVIDGLQVGAFSVLAAGAAVMRNTETDSVWMGNPARCVR
ncbi:hypothetical protein IRZ59_13260 [Pseudomonas guariconensis]|uniref:hypothetical protein n=1 Tax=Pseudomonas guariconensis TaxID=1288410 RepID=UPI0018AB73C5|nr:hypothetical protein [Pseudomonas guariconensis]MBF8731401.1 hypothetical protein [Pseudomonas guariconensis]